MLTLATFHLFPTQIFYSYLFCILFRNCNAQYCIGKSELGQSLYGLQPWLSCPEERKNMNLCLHVNNGRVWACVCERNRVTTPKFLPAHLHNISFHPPHTPAHLLVQYLKHHCGSTVPVELTRNFTCGTPTLTSPAELQL